ncbi:MAG: class I SAM-dependent methyltransferase [Thermoflavifilum sp.]|nr:class I SAM-dependent methyltransferase [Thermoflavifilum sp.]MCL6513556.1 methyltransferase [Alicyclobacillus sp.]
MPSRPLSIEVRVRGVALTLHSDAGVFSKRGLDYGTRLLLESVQLEPDAYAVDLGCGYGVMAAVLGRVYPASRWLLLDVNERAVALARENVRALGPRAQVLQSDGFSAVPDTTADAVVLNPPIRAGKATVYRLFDESYEHLRDGGVLWVVIHKQHGAESAAKHLRERFEVSRVERDAGYHVYRCEKQSRLAH